MSVKSLPYSELSPEQRFNLTHAAIDGFAEHHADPLNQQWYREASQRLESETDPFTLTLREVSDLPLHETPATVANKLPKQHVAQLVFESVGGDLDLAATVTPKIYEEFSDPTRLHAQFEMFRQRMARASYVGGIIMPTQTNYPGRAIISAVLGDRLGLLHPTVVELGGSGGLIVKQQMLSLPYKSVPVGYWTGPNEPFEVDDELTELFNGIANDSLFRPQRAVSMDLVPPMSDMDKVRMMVFTPYPKQWLDPEFVAEFMDLMRAPTPVGHTYHDNDATGPDYDYFAETNGDVLKSGADLTTAITVMHQGEGQKDHDGMIETMRHLTKPNSWMLVQDQGRFIPRPGPATTTRPPRNLFEPIDWANTSFNYEVWLGRNRNPDTPTPVDDFHFLGACDNGHVGAIKISPLFARILRSHHHEL